MNKTISTREDIFEQLNNIDFSYTTDNKNMAWKCVQAAKWLKDEDLEYRARYVHLEQISFGNFDNEVLQYYPWFLNYLDKHPDTPFLNDILWGYKWVLDSINFFGQIPRTQLFEIFDEFKTRYRDYGNTERVILHFEIRLHVYLGEPDKAYALFEQYKTIPKAGALNDCQACMRNNSLEVLWFSGHFKELLEYAKPITSGKVVCHNVPRTTYNKLIYACLMLGKEDLAEVYAQKGYDSLPSEEFHWENIPYVLVQLSLSNKLIKAKKIISRQLNHYYQGVANYYKFIFYHACSVYFSVLEQKQIKTINLKINLFQEPEFEHTSDGIYQVAYLKTFFLKKTKENAQQLDSRNGNNYFVNYLQKDWGFLKHKMM